MAKKGKKSGRWEVERERCRISDRYPSKGTRNAVSMSGLVPAILKNLGLEDSHWSSVLAEQWKDIVGDAVAAHTRPGTFLNGELTIFVDSSVWMSELQRYGKDKITKNLTERFGPGKIKKVGFKLDPGE